MPIKLDPIRRLADRLWADAGRTRRRLTMPLPRDVHEELQVRTRLLEVVVVELEDALREVEQGAYEE
jgi:hypothetical protein